MNYLKLLFLFTFLSTSTLVFAQNSIVKYFGMADPHVYIFEDKAYLYSARDQDSTANHFKMPDWHIWSSEDLVNWK